MPHPVTTYGYLETIDCAMPSTNSLISRMPVTQEHTCHAVQNQLLHKHGFISPKDPDLSKDVNHSAEVE